jgi:hypothetical protein
MNDAILFLNECISAGCDVALIGEGSSKEQLNALVAAMRLHGRICLGHTSCDLTLDESLNELFEFCESEAVSNVVQNGGVLFIDNTAGMRGRKIQPLPAAAEEAIRRVADREDRNCKFSIVLNTTPETVSPSRLDWLSKVSWQ